MMSLSPSVDLKGFASLVKPLLTVFASEGLGLHRISMSLSFQGAPGSYLMRPREHKNMICIFILSSKETESWWCFVWSRCNIDPRGSFSALFFCSQSQPGTVSKESELRPSVHAEPAKRHLKFSKCERDLVENLAKVSVLIVWIGNITVWFQSAPQLPKTPSGQGLAACPCLQTHQLSPQRAFMLSSALKVHATFSEMHFQRLLAAIPVLFPTPALSSPPHKT